MTFVTRSTLSEALQTALGRQYRVDREIGRGGMGVVYLAHDLTLDRAVAVKVVHPDLSSNRAIAGRFLAEARMVAKLRHPNIVAVHSAGEVDGQLYYVMDYHPGETLRQRLGRDRRLPPALAAGIASDIADALDAASGAGVVHRDLKPENILLEGPPDAPRALLTDFGIARLVEGGAGHTGPGAIMGTPAYMSPEQAAGEELDGRSDLYSLGVVAYEMVAGAPPFVGPPRSVISKQILDPPPALVDPALPPTIGAAILRALEKVPEARWPTGKAFRKALAGEETTPTPTVGIRRSSRRRWLPAAIGAVLVAAAAVVALITRDGPPVGTNPRLSILVLPFDNLRREQEYDWLRDGSVNMLSLALSQWRDLTVVDQDRVHDLLASARHPDDQPIGLDLARRLARESGVWTVVLGDYSLVGDSLHLVARRYDVASGRRLDLIQVAGAVAEDVRPLYDELAARLLDLTGAPKVDRASLAAVTSGSLAAYRAYLRGIDALNHWRLVEASTALQEAVRIDSTFSLANYKLAIARGWLSNVDTIGLAAIRRAARTADRLGPRERSLIEGYRTFVDGDYDRGLAIYGELIRRDSADVEAWYGLADAAFHGGYARLSSPLLGQSLRAFRRVIGLDSTFGLAYEHIGAMLTDAAQPRNWLVLAGPDSLIGAAKVPADSGNAAARRLAIDQAVGLTEAWTRLQPNTARAHYQLYKAYLAGGRVAEARRTVGQLRALFPDSVQPLFSLLDARAQFVAGDIPGSAATVRSTMSSIRTGSFAELDFAPEPMIDMLTGVDALGYYGDITSAAQLIRLGGEMRRQRSEARDSTEKAREDDLWELSRLGLLYGASGTRSDRLRAIWRRGVDVVRQSPDRLRESDLGLLAPAAVGLLVGPTSDPSAIIELERLTNRRTPAVLRALVAARAGDSATARKILAETRTDPVEAPGEKEKAEWHLGAADPRPLLAETHFELGEYNRVVEVLARFQPAEFSKRGFDPRWILLPRVRLIRGQALERLGRGPEAAAEYRAVIEQWSGADSELLPIVQTARQRLARVSPTPEVH